MSEIKNGTQWRAVFLWVRVLFPMRMESANPSRDYDIYAKAERQAN